MLNAIFLLHFVLALLFGALATFFPELLARAGTFNPLLQLKDPGRIYGMLFGISLIGIAALLWNARVSASSPARRLTLCVMFVHLAIGALASLMLPGPIITRVIAIVIFVLFFIAYGYVWLYKPGQI